MNADTFELREAWMRSRRLAQEAVSEASKRCEEYARAEAEYYSAKAEVALSMKADGMPVTLIDNCVKGVEGVSEKLFALTLAEGKYRAAMKAIDVYRDDERMTYDEYRRSMMGDMQ